MKPILFNTEMVRAILDGRKTVTRRVIHIPNYGYFMTEPPRVVSRYQTGGILYVRETWLPLDGDHIIDGRKYAYRADSTEGSEQLRTQYGYKWHPSIHMPKEAARIFLRVQDVHVERVQEMSEIDADKEGIRSYWQTPHDNGPPFIGCAKGIENDLCFTRREAFGQLWDSTVKPADLHCYGWDANPWVWVINFERISRDEALKEGGR